MATLTLEELVAGVLACDRAVLGRAITLIESTNVDHQKRASQLLSDLLPRTGKAVRLGITGVPGVGKSTFIEAFGGLLTAAGHRVAVLAVDPTSRRTGGSILGDKTRMQKLASDSNAFIRPSPSSGTLGGVTQKTRESMLVCEAAGFDVILVETVGAGQSETQVSEMVDFFLVLMLPGAGDELQGIKKGVIELADLIAVNKADGDNQSRARAAAAEYRSALHLLSQTESAWRPEVLTCSGLTGSGLEELWERVQAHRELLVGNGELDEKRQKQQRDWMWSLIESRLLAAVRRSPEVAAELARLEAEVVAGERTANEAAAEVLRLFSLTSAS